MIGFLAQWPRKEWNPRGIIWKYKCPNLNNLISLYMTKIQLKLLKLTLIILIIQLYHRMS